MSTSSTAPSDSDIPLHRGARQHQRKRKDFGAWPPRSVGGYGDPAEEHKREHVRRAPRADAREGAEYSPPRPGTGRFVPPCTRARHVGVGPRGPFAESKATSLAGLGIFYSPSLVLITSRRHPLQPLISLLSLSPAFVFGGHQTVVGGPTPIMKYVIVSYVSEPAHGVIVDQWMRSHWKTDHDEQ